MGVKAPPGWDFYLNLQLLTYTEVMMLFMLPVAELPWDRPVLSPDLEHCLPALLMNSASPSVMFNACCGMLVICGQTWEMPLRLGVVLFSSSRHWF